MAVSEKENTKKQAILEAAARLFRDRGYSATSMRDLAEAVALKAPSLYNHIGSKEELLRTICFENGRRFQQGMKEVEEQGGSAPEKVRALIRLHIRVATEDVTSVTAFNDEWRHLTEPYLREFKAVRRDYEARFQAIIEAGIRRGEFQDVDPAIALHTIFSAVRWVYDWYQPGRKITAEELEEQVSGLLMGGLEA